MLLTSWKYREFTGLDTEWTLDDLVLSQVNLLVAKNATGKTRTLNVINSLASLLTGERRDIYQSGMYDVVLKDGATTWRYTLEFDNFVVTREDLMRDDANVLHRGQGGVGRILAEDIEGKPKIRFQVPGSHVAALAKQDNVQHPFLQPILDWAASVRHFSFSSAMDPSNLAVAVKDVRIDVNERMTGQLVPIFHKARQEFRDEFVNAVISDMKTLGYDIEEFVIRRPTTLMLNIILPGELVGLAAKERGLRCLTDQPSISSGMFRALSLLAQANYYVLAKRGGCILVDDIGEGLDFERSCEIIDLLRKKAYSAPFQLIMSTNNRFVMNKVPLEEWCLLQREGHRVRARNYTNSRDAFERFKMTGLSNFDFLRYDFINEDPEAVYEEVGSEGGE